MGAVKDIIAPKAPKPVPPPVIEAPVEMPDPDNSTIQTTQRKKAARRIAKSGRASTLLSSGDSLG